MILAYITLVPVYLVFCILHYLFAFIDYYDTIKNISFYFLMYIHSKYIYNREKVSSPVIYIYSIMNTYNAKNVYVTCHVVIRSMIVDSSL